MAHSPSKFPSVHHTHRDTGVSGTPMDRALVVAVNDPLKQGRVRIRVVGHMDDEIRIPDDQLPWVKVMHGTNMPSLQTSIQTSGLLPGSMVYVNRSGDGGQDYTVIGTIPNDRGDDNQSQHPAAVGNTENISGGGGTDSALGAKGKDDIVPRNPGDKTYGWPEDLHTLVTKGVTTEAARRNRDFARRFTKRTKEPVKWSHAEAPNPNHHGARKNVKDKQGSGTIGVYKWDQAKDSQKFIKDSIKNKSAVVNAAIDMIQTLKKVDHNPEAKESVGSSNFSAAVSQLAAIFSKGGGGGGGNQNQDSEANTTPKITAEQCAQGYDSSYGVTRAEFERQCSLLDENLANTTSNTGIRIVTLYDNGFAGLLNSFSSMISLRVPISNGTLNNATFVGETNVSSNMTFNNTAYFNANIASSNVVSVSSNALFYQYVTLASNLDVNAHFRVLQDGANITGNCYIRSGGLVVGNPLGGMRGSGSINASNIYDDNVLLSCYVFDAALDGYIDTDKWDRIVKKKHRPLRQFIKKWKESEYNPLDLNAYIDHWKFKRHLTSLPNESKYTSLSMGEWIQRLIETVELQAVHDKYLLDKIQLLEKRIAELEKNGTR